MRVVVTERVPPQQTVPEPAPEPSGFAQLYSRAAVGLEAPLVTIEVYLAGGFPRMSIVGLPETAVRESRDRVRAAIDNSGFEFPQHAITVHLAPADLPKHGGRYDLAIALGILAAARQIPTDRFGHYEYHGELGLSGELRPVNAILPAGLNAARAGRTLVVPRANAEEATLAGELNVLAADRLLDVTADLAGLQPLSRIARTAPPARPPRGPDIVEVRGQARAKRALEIAAAGGHNLLFCGPPGSGKSMLARRLPGILPPMTEAEALEHASVESLLGRAPDVERFFQRPFRAPHHTASAAALIGGGSVPKPGEASRAHLGVLFLDELPEFSRYVLEVLREPLECGFITISRAALQTDFPAAFQLVAAMNPCPCGYSGDSERVCRCTPDQITRYRGRISGPLLDRIDLAVTLGRVSYKELRAQASDSESSAEVAERVCRALAIQRGRAGTANARLVNAISHPRCRLDSETHTLMAKAVQHYFLSARSVERVLRVARTIADLAAVERIAASHLAEALSLRTGFDEVGRRAALAGDPI